MDNKLDYNKCESIFESYAIYSGNEIDFSWRKLNQNELKNIKKVMKKGRLLITIEKNKVPRPFPFILIQDKLIQLEVL